MISTDVRIESDKEQEKSFSLFASMDYLLDKLKLLNYETEFLPEIKIRAIHKYYFALQKNSGEQFYLFCLLSAWLIRKLGKKFNPPEEYDDPNDTIGKIVEEGMKIDFPVSKLKQGVGESVVNILDFLANAVLKKNSLMLQKPKPPEEKEEEMEVVEDDSEVNLDRVEEEMIAAYSDDSDEENIFQLDKLKPIKGELHQENFKNNINEDSWKLEVERVLPLLKVTVKNENRDWRFHLEQMKGYKTSIDESFGNTRSQLEKLHNEIRSTLEKINNREKYLNRELENALGTYRTQQGRLSFTKEKYKTLSGAVAEKNRELHKLNDKVDLIKQQMEERESAMTDGTPLVNLKKSISKLKTEILDMDVRIGVLECLLLQHKILEEKQLETDFGQSLSLF
ncbi:intraflagellar transport protein 57 homolog isoform X2 [Cylas formicarius]|uniref:intraflagellar transport protein 57 homolog isoform X2 n=1 Tax=Cylas formicarius TaxID=197179 RepID=UPI0029583B20|nr:intraflagellar transport protein 57 homolog isoform X2 [Cylas formicarius]